MKTLTLAAFALGTALVSNQAFAFGGWNGRGTGPEADAGRHGQAPHTQRTLASGPALTGWNGRGTGPDTDAASYGPFDRAEPRLGGWDRRSDLPGRTFEDDGHGAGAPAARQDMAGTHRPRRPGALGG